MGEPLGREALGQVEDQLLFKATIWEAFSCLERSVVVPCIFGAEDGPKSKRREEKKWQVAPANCR